jgi:aspartate aminotransferase
VPVSDKIKENMEMGSWIRRMFEEAIEMRRQFGGDNIFDLSIGSPTLEPPTEFKDELKRLANNPLPGMHRYMPNAGYTETREAVAARLSRDTGVAITGDSIIMTCGAAGALNVAMRAILNQGEEVILFAPYFLEFLNYIFYQGGEARILPTDEGFMPRMDVLEDAIGPRTRAVLINSPNNPTAVVYGEDIIRQIAELLERKSAEYGHDIFLLSDEAYSRIIYDGMVYSSPLKHYPRSIIAGSHSKDLGLSGERIGFIALHPECPQHDEMMDGMTFCNRTLGFVSAPALIQRLVTTVQDATVAVSEYQRKRDFIYGHLIDMGYSVIKPQGTFYIFPRSPLEDDVAFIRELQWEHHVITSPGLCFGAPGYFRISYSVEDWTLEGSIPGLAALAKKYKLK